MVNFFGGKGCILYLQDYSELVSTTVGEDKEGCKKKVGDVRIIEVMVIVLNYVERTEQTSKGLGGKVICKLKTKLVLSNTAYGAEEGSESDEGDVKIQLLGLGRNRIGIGQKILLGVGESGGKHEQRLEHYLSWAVH